MSSDVKEGKGGMEGTGLVPRLRFPGHFGDEDWKLIKICEIGYILGGLSGKSAVDFGCGSPYVTYRQVFSQAKIDFSACDKVTIAVDETQNTLQKGDIIFTGSSETPEEVGISLVVVDDVDFPVYLNSFCFILRPGSMGTLLPSFSMYLFQSPQYRASVTAIAQGSTRFNLSKSAFRELSVLLPEKVSEQDKIADCLSSLDGLITLESQKLNALKSHKKGLMQQLFPAEGETVPRLRFPEFRGAGEWKSTRLDELLFGHPNYGVNAPAVPYSEDLPAYLRITDISDEGYFLCDKKASVAINVTDENYLSEGDIVLARTGASVGKSYKFRKEDGKLVFAGFLIRIKPDPKKIDSTFLFNFLSTQQYWKWVGVTSARSGQPGINGNEYASLPIPVPPHETELSEQQKIANCLTSLDDLIAAQAQKVEALKTHKKGLMQQLFPKLEEV